MEERDVFKIKDDDDDRESGPMLGWLRDWPEDQGVASSIPETTDFLTNSSGQWTSY